MRRRHLNSAITVKAARRKIGNIPELLRLASVGAALALIFAGLAVLGLPSVAQAGPVKPTVSSFTVTPSALNSAGGSVTLSAQVTNAASCLFTSNKLGITGLPATVPCSNGTVTDVVSVPANSGKRTTKYRLHLLVTGARTVNAKAVSLFVSAGPVPPPPPPPSPAPTDVMATPAYEALDVMWTPEPPGVGYEVDGYTVTATGPNLVVPQTCTGATTCFVGGLTNGMQYSVTVQAYVTVYGDNGAPLGNQPVGGSSSAVMATPSGAQNCSYIGQYASLGGCDLSNADLSNVNLMGSDLSDANLTNANLTNANVNSANLQGANLTGAILTGADAGGAHFQDAIMTNAVVSDVNFDFADLSGADLSGADLSNAFLDNANLSDANLSNANLTGAIVTATSMTGTIWNDTTCPDGTNSNTYSPQTCANDLN